MKRLLIVTGLTTGLALSAVLTAGCVTGSGGNGQAAQSAAPGMAAQTSILALQTWLMIQQGKANESATQLAKTNPTEAARQRARATAAGSIMTSLGTLRVESNCARRLQLANAVSTGLQAEFPNYQAELGLGTNLVTVLASGMPGCQ